MMNVKNERVIKFEGKHLISSPAWFIMKGSIRVRWLKCNMAAGVQYHHAELWMLQLQLDNQLYLHLLIFLFIKIWKLFFYDSLFSSRVKITFYNLKLFICRFAQRPTHTWLLASSSAVSGSVLNLCHVYVPITQLNICYTSHEWNVDLKSRTWSHCPHCLFRGVFSVFECQKKSCCWDEDGQVETHPEIPEVYVQISCQKKLIVMRHKYLKIFATKFIQNPVFVFIFTK